MRLWRRRLPAEPFDWPLFLKNLPFQPVPVWVAGALLVKPLARATPWLLRAACSGAVRQGVVNVAIVAYASVLPAALAAAVYLLVGRRRMRNARHRLFGDSSLALVLLASALIAASMARLVHAGWTTLGPGLHALRGACWK